MEIDYPILSVHIPKTAGRSMMRYMVDLFGANKILLDNEGQSVRPVDKIVGEKINPKLKETVKTALFTSALGKRLFTFLHKWNSAGDSQQDLNILDYKIIHGHFDWLKYPHLSKITNIREPLERAYSHYSFLNLQHEIGNADRAAENDWFEPTMEFEDYFRQEPVINFQSKCLHADLNTFDLVGVTDNLENYANNLARLCGINTQIREVRVNANPHKKTMDITNQQRQDFYMLNQDDVDLYKQAQARHIDHTRILSPEI